MLKKAKAESEAGSESGAPASKATEIADKILKSSHSIWLAGLGAFAKAQQEGTKVFETLVKQGLELEQNTKQAASETAAVAREAAMSKAKEMQQMAGGTWDKLEQVFEDRVARALSKLGVYTQNDVQRLAERVEELGQSVNKLLQSQPDGAARMSSGISSGGATTARTSKAVKRPAAAKQRSGKRAAKAGSTESNADSSGVAAAPAAKKRRK